MSTTQSGNLSTQRHQLLVINNHAHTDTVTVYLTTPLKTPWDSERSGDTNTEA